MITYFFYKLDTNTTDNFDGNYSSLAKAPIVYNIEGTDAIRKNIRRNHSRLFFKNLKILKLYYSKI